MVRTRGTCIACGWATAGSWLRRLNTNATSANTTTAMAAALPTTTPAGKPSPSSECAVVPVAGAVADDPPVDCVGDDWDTVNVAVADPQARGCAAANPISTTPSEALAIRGFDVVEVVSGGKAPVAAALTVCLPGAVPSGTVNAELKLVPVDVEVATVLSSRETETVALRAHLNPDPDTTTRVPGVPDEGLSEIVCATAGLAVAAAQAAPASSPAIRATSRFMPGSAQHVFV
jgi:hypothetical protein